MRIVHGSNLANTLRAATDAATTRLWVASPFVGAWAGNVRRVLGAAWQKRVKDVRLLTDVSAKGVRKSTALQFGRRGAVRTLTGLHAKLYIADDFVMVSSANLTGTAFQRRYEIGVILSGADARHAVQVFEQWWTLVDTLGVDPEALVDEPRAPLDPEEAPGTILPVLHALPVDVPDQDLPPDVFGDYDRYLRFYDRLMAVYLGQQRLWPDTPERFEVDGFLNYLYRHAAGRPSRAYVRKPPRKLGDQARKAEIVRHARRFARDWSRQALGGDNATWRSMHAKHVQRLLKKNRRQGITRDEFRELLLLTNSMRFYAFNLVKAVNPNNHSLAEIRHLLRTLVDDRVPIQRRMSDSVHRISGVGKSTIQELVGFNWPNRYPLRNATSNAGLRFFGFDVRVG